MEKKTVASPPIFKPGDVVRAISERYAYTRKDNHVVGEVIEVPPEIYDRVYDIHIRILYDKSNAGIGMVFPVFSQDFELVSEEEARGYKLVYNTKYASHHTPNPVQANK